MYKNIKSIEISENVIKFETNDNKGSVKSTIPFNFDSKLMNQRHEYDCNDNYKVVIYKNNLVVYQWSEVVLKLFIPTPVRYYIIKDIRLKGVFTLEYRKHLRNEYDSQKHIFVQMNYISDDLEEIVNKVKKKVEKYSKGIHNIPILVCFRDVLEDVIRYSIISSGVVVESGYEPCVEKVEKTRRKLPDIYTVDE
jgi:hypothetical protein